MGCLGLNAQTTNYIHTSGKNIIGPCGDVITLRGINYAPYNWGGQLSDLRINQIAQTGSNTVRLVWYANNPNSSVYNNYVALDSLLSKCVQYKMIPILELHDFTGGDSGSDLIAGAAWWYSQPIFSLLKKYKQSIIVNIANEVLKVMYEPNSSLALASYKTTYQTIISNMRNVPEFDFPIMIDAPDWGQNSDAFITNNTAQALVLADPKHNLIFSAHAYWYGFANNDSLQMATKINNILSLNIPFVLGELANQQDDVTNCQYNLNYKQLLNYCQAQNVSWLAWAWDRDNCPNRQISSTGNFDNLTTYGNDILYNNTYGLITKPRAKSEYLLNNGACSNISILNQSDEENNILIYPNPAKNIVNIQTLFPIKSIEVNDIIGNKILIQLINNNSFKIEQPCGIYFINITNNNNQTKTFKFLIN